MPYICENRSVRPGIVPDTRFQLKEFLMQEVNRAWSENQPCGRISCEWDEDSIILSISSGGKPIVSTVYSIMK